jgi:predicted nucleic acid-binding protein
MTRVVVDASVSLKWALNDEEYVEQAVALRDAAIFERRFQMFAPSLCLKVQLVDPDPLDIYRIACRYDIAAYDAAYFALSQLLNAVLWTGDQRLYAVLQKHTHLVRWIGEFTA